jgi:adenylate cyclase
MDTLGPSDSFQFDRFRLHSRDGCLLRRDAAGTWTPVAIGSRAVAVLGVLIDRHGDIVSKDEIMRIVWPGTVVGEGNLTVQISALRRVLDDGKTGDSYIQTIPGRGYRLAHRPTELASQMPDAPAAAEPVRQIRPPRPSRRWLVALSFVLALAVLVIIVVARSGWFAEPSARPRVSIVVLPFQNLSGNPAEDYLADGITDDLTSDISRLPGTFVVARQSAYTYQGKMVGVGRIGEELGVRYALEGSVRKLGDELRVNAQLVATETGAHLWADRFDQPLKDLSAGQEEIVRRIGQSLNVAVTDVESARSKRERPTNPDAFDLILRAQSLWLHPMGPREHAERMALLDRALQLDPSSILAMTGLANELILDMYNFRNFTGDGLSRAARLVEDSRAINPNHPAVLASTALLLRGQERYSEAIAAYRHLLDNYPNAHFAYSQIGMLLNFLGRVEEAIPMLETAIRREPRNPSVRVWYDNLGWAQFALGRYEESIVWYQRALAAASNASPIARAQYNLRIAAACVRLGQQDEAHRAIAEANRLWPYDTVRAHWPEDPSSRQYVAHVESYQAALRLAGHRDHAEEDADFGVVSDRKLPEGFAGPTATTVPGATTIHTAELQRLLADRKPIVIDPMLYWWGRSIPGAIGLKHAGSGGSYSDTMQDRLGRKMLELTGGDLSRPIVAVGFNAERFDGRNLALRLVALGYTQVNWYRGGREAWEVSGLPETEVDTQEW